MAKRILVVDDSSTVRQQLKHTLSGEGYDVDEASNGAEALEVLRANPFDLLIVDINMPVMGGLELIREVRNLGSHTATPIFVLTTESLMNVAQEGKEAGATAWIVKPFDRDHLLRGIDHVLAA